MNLREKLKRLYLLREIEIMSKSEIEKLNALLIIAFESSRINFNLIDLGYLNSTRLSLNIHRVLHLHVCEGINNMKTSSLSFSVSLAGTVEILTSSCSNGLRE